MAEEKKQAVEQPEDQRKNTVNKGKAKVKETTEKHPNLFGIAKRIFWCTFGALLVIFAPKAAERLSGTRTETCSVNEATEG